MFVVLFHTVISVKFSLRNSPGKASQRLDTLPQHPQRLCLGSVTNPVGTGRSHVTCSNMGGVSAEQWSSTNHYSAHEFKVLLVPLNYFSSHSVHFLHREALKEKS